MRCSHARLLTVVAVVAGVLFLAGCARTVSLSGEEHYLPPCETTSDIEVESLNGNSPPSCAPFGSYVVFPDGERLEVREGVAVTSHEGVGVTSRGPSPKYVVYYFGTHGLAASFTDGKTVEWWSHTEKALELGQYLAE